MSDPEERHSQELTEEEIDAQLAALMAEAGEVPNEIQVLSLSRVSLS